MNKQSLLRALFYKSIPLNFNLSDALDVLSQRERIVLEKRYKLNNGQPTVFREIAADFGVTGERIRQIESKALRKIRYFTRR